ncbi:MAG: hypothetical protein J6Q21_02505, partial [Alistipes sp.]|nr:hypothetical protein [Alistipes sp.]
LRVQRYYIFFILQLFYQLFSKKITSPHSNPTLQALFGDVDGGCVMVSTTPRVVNFGKKYKKAYCLLGNFL